MWVIRKLGSFFFETIQLIVFAVSIFLVIYLLVLQPHKIKGASMEPNFVNGEYLLTDKLSYRFGDPERGDIIVFKAPPTYKDEFIKRIVGLPGEQVSVVSGKVLVNGKTISEEYLPNSFYTTAGKFATEGKTITISSDNYFVLGDNRSHSLDSRNFGLITRDKITGRAWVVYWPPAKAGTIEAPEYLF